MPIRGINAGSIRFGVHLHGAKLEFGAQGFWGHMDHVTWHDIVRPCAPRSIAARQGKDAMKGCTATRGGYEGTSRILLCRIAPHHGPKIFQNSSRGPLSLLADPGGHPLPSIYPSPCGPISEDNHVAANTRCAGGEKGCVPRNVFPCGPKRFGQ
jgi:hypothetical protein